MVFMDLKASICTEDRASSEVLGLQISLCLWNFLFGMQVQTVEHIFCFLSSAANVCIRSTDVVEGFNASVTCGSALCTVYMCRDRRDCHTLQKGHWH